MKCPGFEKLTDYIDSRDDSIARDSFAPHIASCSACQADVTWYATISSICASDDTIVPPNWVLNRALKLFEAASARAGLAERVGRVVARLLFDSGVQPTLAGARSSGIDARQMLFQAEDFSIDLQVEHGEPAHAGLTGQILREGEGMFESVAERRLTLLSNGRNVVSTTTNSRGEFTIQTVECGSYDLEIDISDLSITIVGLSLS